MLGVSQWSFANDSQCETEIREYQGRIDDATTSDEFGRPTHNLGVIKEIERSIQTSIDACGDSVGLMLLLVDTSLMQGKNALAIASAEKALDMEPNNPLANQYYSMALSTGTNEEEILRYQRRAYELAPNNSQIQVNYCSVLEASGDYKEALRICTKYIESGAVDIAPAIYIRGRAYQALGMSEESKKDFAAAKSKGFDGDPYYSDEHYGK